MRGVTGWGVHLPYPRLDRSAIRDVAGAGGGKGTRTVASYDEDTTTMGAEAARGALLIQAARVQAARGRDSRPGSLWFATTEPAYADRTNATVLHAVLRLDRSVPAYDLTGSVRSAMAAVRAAWQAPGASLAVTADTRTGLPGSGDEAAVGAEKVKDGGYSGLNAFPVPGDGTARSVTAAAMFSMVAPAYAKKYGVPLADMKTALARVAAAAADAYAQAGIAVPRAELAMAEVHDCFTPAEIVLTEDLGLADRGTAWKEVLSGTFDLDGEIPVNPDGGLKAFGHPVGASGLRMMFEAWLQLRGEAPEERRISTYGKRSLALTHNLGGYPGEMVSFVSIVGLG